MTRHHAYIPALGRDGLTPLYDPLQKWIMREEKFKRDLIARANIRAGNRVLDLGCGTGTLTILIKQAQPQAHVFALDADPHILEIAFAKAARQNIEITFERGLAFQLPYPDHAFDRVLSSLVLHHLTADEKERAAREVWRVLRPGGELHVADLGKPHNAYARFVSILTRRLERASENIQGLLPKIFRNAGFTEVEETARLTTFFGTLVLYQANKPQ